MRALLLAFFAVVGCSGQASPVDCHQTEWRACAESDATCQCHSGKANVVGYKCIVVGSESCESAPICEASCYSLLELHPLADGTAFTCVYCSH
jgi:hypothetical protein